MAKHGILLETDAQFIAQCINRAGVATIDLDGGAVVAIGRPTTTDNELYALTAPTATTKTVGIVFNPSVRYDDINGKLFPAKSADDRDYYNIKNKPVDFFIPEKNVEFGIVAENIEGSTMPTVGKFLELTANKTTFTVKDSQTEGAVSFEVVEIRDIKYPKFDFTEETVKVYIVATRNNG